MSRKHPRKKIAAHKRQPRLKTCKSCGRALQHAYGAWACLSCGEVTPRASTPEWAMPDKKRTEEP